ncbi:MAG TPA: DUF1080 domain-containing protein [Woeseiaceae bacterium]|nr:DUF1080 domain-containing protein [Woeseiaceae bacterium]
MARRRTDLKEGTMARTGHQGARRAACQAALSRALLPLLAATPAMAAIPAAAGNAGWQALFDGRDLDGWTRAGGAAEYSVVDGAIVGRSVADTPNTFLVTEERYGDFILEYEARVDPALNSGVQVRSNLDERGIVAGYQVEIDPSERAFTGGIYDEQRRQWLYPLSRNETGRGAFRNGTWNRFRVEAIGDTINVWVNGIQTARLVDDMTGEGFIGLQVHGIADAALAGTTVAWRNLRILTHDLEQHRQPADPAVVELSFLVNRLSDYERRHGWRLLWDGETSDGWQGARLDTFPGSGWTIADGALTVEATDGGEAAGPGDIVTTASFGEFELALEFRITEGANSGIKYYVDPEQNRGEGSAIGCEFQILDDERHPDAKEGVAGNRTLGALYDLIAPENHSAPGRPKQFKGIGAWNQARIVARGGRVEHWLNNEKVVEFDRTSQAFRALVAYSKYRVWPGFCQWPDGRILLQDHGNEVSFRSIKVREF